MDPVTHTLVGVGMANAFFRRRVGRESVPILALASNLPDLDTIVHLTGSPAVLMMRRTFGHSLLLVPLWALLLALPLLLAIVPAARPRIAGMSRAPLACVIIYLAFCGASRHLAGRALSGEAAALRGRPDFAYVFPEPLGSHRWRGVLRSGDRYRVYLVHSLSGKVELKEEVRTQTGDPRVEQARRSPFGRRLEAFFKAPVWRVDAMPEAAGETGRNAGAGLTEDRTPAQVSAYDLRFLSLVLARRHVFEYAFQLGMDGQVGQPTWHPEPARPGDA